MPAAKWKACIRLSSVVSIVLCITGKCCSFKGVHWCGPNKINSSWIMFWAIIIHNALCTPIVSRHTVVGCMFRVRPRTYIYSVSQTPPLRFSEIFSQTVGNFNQFLTHLLYDHFYTRVQIFIQISPTLTKLCHTKRDHLAKFYISL